MSKSKQVLVIRKDLNMRKGKIASQAAHASMKVLLDMMVPPSWVIAPNDNGVCVEVRELRYDTDSALADWVDGSFTKITVGVNSEAELLEVHERAKAAGIITSLIKDEGRTEFGGVPTYTAIAVGPDWSEKIDPITGHLTLL